MNMTKVETLKLKIEANHSKVVKAETSLQKNIKKLEALAGGSESDLYVAERDVRTSQQKLDKIKSIIQKDEKALADEIERQVDLNELPEVLTIMASQLEKIWNEYDKNRRNSLRDDLFGHSFREFMRTHTVADYKFLDMTDEQIEAKNHRDAQDMVLDLQLRVWDKAGYISDWSGVQYKDKALNGWITGDKGKVEVRSILAGGHSIQKLHIRVLVL